MSRQTPHDPSPTGDGFNEAAFKRKLGQALIRLVIFCSVYFSAAVIATGDFAHIAGIQILGMPLAIYTGLLVFAVGIIVMRMCLTDNKGD